MKPEEMSLQLPQVQYRQQQTTTESAGLALVLSSKKRCEDLLSPILSRPVITPVAPVGAPPRLRRRPVAAVPKADISSELALISDSTSSSCPSSQGQRSPERRPPVPRMAAKRLQPPKLKALVDKPRRPKLECRPPSPLTVAETLYTRDMMGPAYFRLWRSDLDSEVTDHDVESAEFAGHRMDCKRAEQQRCRDQAASWRVVHDRDLAVQELRWRLQQESEVLVQRPKDQSAVPMVKGRIEGDRPPSCPRFSTPVPPKQVEARGRRRISTRGSAEDDRMEDSSAPAEDATGLSPTPPPRRASADGIESPESKSMGLLKYSNLRPKQPLQQRQRRVLTNRREKLQQLVALRADVDDGPFGNEECLAPELRLRLLKRVGKGSGRLFNALKPEPQALWLHRVRDVAAVRRVFEAYDRDGNRTLDHDELRALLTDLGLRARTHTEREQLRLVLHSFDTSEVSLEDLVEHIIPRVRWILAEVNREYFKALFDSSDTDGDGSLTINELTQALRLMGASPSLLLVEAVVLEVIPEAAEDLRTIDGRLLMARSIASFEQFLLIAVLIQERADLERSERARLIAQTHELTPDEELLWGPDVVDLSDSFRRFCSGGNETLLAAHVSNVVHHSGILSSGRSVLKRLSDNVSAISSPQDMLTFKQLLEVLGPIRRQEQDAIQQVFEMHKRDEGGLPLLSCQMALHDCDVTPRSEAEAREVVALVEEFDEDASGMLDLEEFGRLARFAAQRLRRTRREIERQRLFEHNWTEERFQEYRTAFMMHTENMSDTLTWKQAAEAAQQAATGECGRPGREAAAAALAELPENQRGHVELVMFLDLMKAIEKQEAMRQAALEAGVEEESVGLFCKEWMRLRPNKDGLVPSSRVKKYAGINSKAPAELNFADFVNLVQKARAADKSPGG